MRLRKTFQLRYTMKEKLISQITDYSPVNEQEETDKVTLLRWLQKDTDISIRDNTDGHLTASAWVVNPARTHVLMAYHKLYDSWAWLGGHADGNWDLQAVAEKEAREESGIQNLKLLTDAPVSLEVLTVTGHEKKGKYVPCHLHLNLTYLFEAADDQALACKPDENSGVDWIPVDELSVRCNEPWFVQRIYSKLAKKAMDL